MAAAISAVVAYLAHKWQKKEWDYDINAVTLSAGLFYGYVFLVPLGLFLVLKYFSAPSGLVQLWCLYGYSLFIFIPASVSMPLSLSLPLSSTSLARFITFSFTRVHTSASLSHFSIFISDYLSHLFCFVTFGHTDLSISCCFILPL